ncbi:uncharacterized protein CCOS01_07736 [Colletotrichum costaricense]|uniref:Uncharacterized protein n=1 Tax=Colletotrichum costaricense TaxID=1209916 RepID=A0AAJ0E0F7_9PEZI|nr:uncharacterized protein CCOS01_07736 [Colletotrichum costaricense]KAI3551492.1 hypothetical protein CSPX01_00834 [Colletotrichum filicis]KAK1527474.1 hypothetical protein CCOS01_07736 [Colletotrichum costaricense]
MCGFGHSPQQGYDSEQGCMGPRTVGFTWSYLTQYAR